MYYKYHIYNYYYVCITSGIASKIVLYILYIYAVNIRYHINICVLYIIIISMYVCITSGMASRIVGIDGLLNLAALIGRILADPPINNNIIIIYYC